MPAPKALKASDVLTKYRQNDEDCDAGLVLARAAGISETELEGYFLLGETHARVVFPFFGLPVEYPKALQCPECAFRSCETNRLLHHLQKYHGWSIKEVGTYVRKLEC